MNEDIYDLEILISKILRVGVLISGLFLLVGWIFELRGSGRAIVEFQTYHGHNLPDTLSNLLATQNWASLVSYIGLIVLILLPFLRVVMTVILFALRKERVMATVAAFVAIALVISSLLGLEL
jgi:uncharacterized membrane protein